MSPNDQMKCFYAVSPIKPIKYRPVLQICRTWKNTMVNGSIVQIHTQRFISNLQQPWISNLVTVRTWWQWCWWHREIFTICKKSGCWWPKPSSTSNNVTNTFCLQHLSPTSMETSTFPDYNWNIHVQAVVIYEFTFRMSQYPIIICRVVLTFKNRKNIVAKRTLVLIKNLQISWSEISEIT